MELTTFPVQYQPDVRSKRVEIEMLRLTRATRVVGPKMYSHSRDESKNFRGGYGRDHSKEEWARAVLIQYHDNGNPESAVVKLELEKMRASTEYEAENEASQKWWDYRMLVDNK